MDTYLAAVAEIERFHLMVATWLRGDETDLTEEILLDRFPDTFKFFAPDKPMLTGKHMRTNWAAAVRGTLPTLNITVNQFIPIYQDERVAIVHYVETQAQQDCQRTHRAIAVLQRIAGGTQMNWVMQHESVLEP